MGATMVKNGNLLDALPQGSGTLHIVMLGLDSAGKTTALYRLKFDQYLNTVPTIGFNCEKVHGTLGKAKGIHFLVWDVGGQEKLRPLWRSYTRCTDGILFVVDSVDVERMEEAKMELMRTAKCPDNQQINKIYLTLAVPMNWKNFWDYTSFRTHCQIFRLPHQCQQATLQLSMLTTKLI
ncbi:ADP-ribosylation factor-like protein 4A isoform X2 [Drosophila busckii]|uniref:ADP-ribosylation factor-like protein 4A isoform X2 n=1 Tax=Drosophila busckii TaxID=30019 RepID=UPI00083F1B20|nr:ADP-ribosylation factor-like protein 4A isoform X2 [Drosophila busckii]